VRELGALAVQIVEDAERLWQRLRLSNAEYEQLAAMGDAWWRIAPAMSAQAAHALIYRLGPARFTDRVLLAWARSGTAATDTAWRELATWPARWTARRFPLKAADLIRRGLEKGPDLGRALRAAEQAWIDADFPKDPAVIAAIADAAARPPG
jgi:poly(A) polymerase